MEWLVPVGLAVCSASLLTYCDLDAVFNAPPQALQWGPWLRLQAWWWGFILLNGALAGFLCYALREKDFVKGLDPWLAGLIAGASYTALVRLKFTTLPNNTPFGLETFYEALKGLVHRRINGVVRSWRMQECARLAQADLASLRDQALLMVGSDSLLSEPAKAEARQWILVTAADNKTPEVDRRRALALYIITERKPG
jgi:hypothetical protein